jgi:glycosyltransferase involved in cell wall biosynthesis
MPDNHPCLHFSQEYIFSLGFTKWYQENIKKWLASAGAIIVYNDFIKKMLDPFSSNIHVISSGVDTKKFTPKVLVETESKPVKILMTGRTNDYLKGFWTVKDALKILWEKRQDFELLVTAAFDLEFDEPYIKNLGWLTPEEVQKVYHQGQINLVPSIWVEPFGITAVEAMASGLPVIASNMGGPAISTIDNETGILVEPGNAVKLAEAINRLLDNPELRKKMGAAARKRAEEVFDWDMIVKEKYIPLLNHILS